MSAGLLLVLLTAGQATPAESASLPPKLQQDVKVACAAFERGQSLETARLLAPIVARGKYVAAVEEELERTNLPAVGEILARCRVALLHRGLEKEIPRPGPKEIVLLLPAMKDYVLEVLEEISRKPVMADVLPLPETIARFQALSYHFDTLSRQLDELEQSAKFLLQLAKRLPQGDLAKLDGEIRAMVENDDVATLIDSIEAMKRGLKERAVEMAIARLALAGEILSRDEMGPEHILASGTWNVDYQKATDFLKSASRNPPRRKALREEGLLQRVNELGDKARRAAGSLTAKSKLLFDGLNWWSRGRYGAGPDVMGLAKSEAALRSRAAMFWLYMPSAPPVPTDPFAKPNAKTVMPQPLYQRRHLYTWTWRNRYVHDDSFSFDTTYQVDQKFKRKKYVSPCSGTIHWRTELVSATEVNDSAYSSVRKIVDKDDQSMLRLVGYLEYGMALRSFDQLLKTASLTELKAMDELIQQEPRYAVYTNLSRKFVQTATSNFTERSDEPDDNFQRHGLDWVIALARLEAGAMLAGFTTKKDPFALAPPGAFERKAYEELLVDSMRLHLWSFFNDPLSTYNNLRRQNSNVVLIYERRARLAVKFIHAVRKWAGPRLTPAHQRELKQYEDRLLNIIGGIQTELLNLGEDSAFNRNTRPIGKKEKK